MGVFLYKGYLIMPMIEYDYWNIKTDIKNEKVVLDNGEKCFSMSLKKFSELTDKMVETRNEALKPHSVHFPQANENAVYGSHVEYLDAVYDEIREFLSSESENHVDMRLFEIDYMTDWEGCGHISVMVPWIKTVEYSMKFSDSFIYYLLHDTENDPDHTIPWLGQVSVSFKGDW